MSAVTKNYMDLDNLESYDTLIKEYIGGEDASAYKTILSSADGKSIFFYKKAGAALTDTPDFTLSAYAPYVSGNTLYL